MRGFATWNPTEGSLEILEMIQKVLREYADYLPLTGRQIFYRLVGAFGFEKTEKGANRVYGVLGRARRAGMIPFASIRDGGGAKVIPQTWADSDAFWDGVRSRWRHYSRNRQAGQPVYVELFCEAPGMMEQLQAVAFPYSVPVYGTRGFSGLSVTAEIARRALQRDVPTMLLQVGDYDPSGESIFASMSGDAIAFIDQIRAGYDRGGGVDAGGVLAELLGADEVSRNRLSAVEDWVEAGPDLDARRVALTWDQVEEHQLPTAPVSLTKSGGKNPHSHGWVGETAQLEAMPPDLLARTVDEAIQDVLDMDRYHQEVAREKADRDAIEERLP